MIACPSCQGAATVQLKRVTTLGYRLFRCRPCRRIFNERTGTPFNHLQVPTDIVLFVVHDELRDHVRFRRHLSEAVPASTQRRLFLERWSDRHTALRAT